MPTYHDSSGKKAFIMNMYTRPDYRRRGIAYRVLELLTAEAEMRWSFCGVKISTTLYQNTERRNEYGKNGHIDC